MTGKNSVKQVPCQGRMMQIESIVTTQVSRSAYTQARRLLLLGRCSFGCSTALLLRKRCLGLCRGSLLVGLRLLRTRSATDLNSYTAFQQTLDNNAVISDNTQHEECITTLCRVTMSGISVFETQGACIAP